MWPLRTVADRLSVLVTSSLQGSNGGPFLYLSITSIHQYCDASPNLRRIDIVL